MHCRKYISIYQWLSTAIFVLLMWATTAAQVTTAKPANPNITAPTPQRHEPAGGQRPAGNTPSIANAPPPNTTLTMNPGDVEGFVYWDVSAITHKPAGTCNGLAVNVSLAGSPPTNTIPTGNHFKYAGQVKTFLYGGKVQVYEVCIYAYDHQPVGPQLQAQLIVDRNAFSIAPAAKTPIVAPITIINGQCNMLPPIVPSSVGDLTAHWGSCQNRAYDVNFALAPAFQVMSSGNGSGGMLSSANKGSVNPGPTQPPAGELLSGGVNPGPQQSPSRGMLSGARDPGPIQTPAVGKAAAGQLLVAKSGARTLTNADVIGLLKGGVPESAIINQINSSNKNFDFSPASCQALAQAKVNPKILDAMGDGSVRPCYTGGVRSGTGSGADDLNPQPFPPKGSSLNTPLAGPQTPAQLPGSTPRGSGNTVQLNPQPFPPKGSIGPEQTLSASSSPSPSIAGPKLPRPLLSGRSSQQGAIAPVPSAGVVAKTYTGTVSGFIYWDTAKTKFKSSCDGVGVRAFVDHGSMNSWEGSASPLTYSASGPLAVCMYTITGAPTGIPLDISADVGWPYITFGIDIWSLAAPGNQAKFSVAWGGEILGEYDIVTVQKTACDAGLNSKVMAAQSNLQSGPRSCGNQATNVNLILSSTPPPLSGSNTGGSGAGAQSRTQRTLQPKPHNLLSTPQSASRSVQ